jgi:uroporphyrinogen decarboxylase
MTGRERLLRAVQRQQPDRVPVTLAYGHIDRLCQQRGHPEMVGRLRQDQDTVSFRLRSPTPDAFARYHRDLPPNATINEWGVANVRSSTGASTLHIPPLADLDDARALDAYPFPDLTEPWRHADLEAQVAAAHARGVAAVGQMSQTIFELAHLLRGFEALLVDFALGSAFAEALLDRLAAIRCQQARRFAQAGVDVLRVGDDIAGQQGMLMNPSAWRHWLKPRLASVIEAARRIDPALPVKYHSDGRPLDVLPDLIEIGVTILNPVQPECLDQAALKRTYGDRLAFWGCIGVQSTLPHGTPAQVRAAVREVIRTVGAGGGLVLGPTHSVEPDVPWENIVAFYEAAEEYGRY